MSEDEQEVAATVLAESEPEESGPESGDEREAGPKQVKRPKKSNYYNLLQQIGIRSQKNPRYLHHYDDLSDLPEDGSRQVPASYLGQLADVYLSKSHIPSDWRLVSEEASQAINPTARFVFLTVQIRSIYPVLLAMAFMFKHQLGTLPIRKCRFFYALNCRDDLSRRLLVDMLKGCDGATLKILHELTGRVRRGTSKALVEEDSVPMPYTPPPYRPEAFLERPTVGNARKPPGVQEVVKGVLMGPNDTEVVTPLIKRPEFIPGTSQRFIGARTQHIPLCGTTSDLYEAVKGTLPEEGAHGVNSYYPAWHEITKLKDAPNRYRGLMCPPTANSLSIAKVVMQRLRPLRLMPSGQRSVYDKQAPLINMSGSEIGQLAANMGSPDITVSRLL